MSINSIHDVGCKALSPGVVAPDATTAKRFAALIERIAVMALPDAALECARQGVPIFPCLAGNKEPACHNGWHDATDDEVTVAGWWCDDPAYNIGFPPGRISMAVVDLDTYKPDYVPPEQLPPTLVTGCRGEHHYFIGATHDGKLPGCIDIKSEGGYILLPPSVFDGKPYRVIHQRDVAPTPDWVLSRQKHTRLDETPPENLVADDTDQALRDEGAARVQRYVARFGVAGAEPRGNRAFALGGLLYGMRRGTNVLSVGKIIGLMRDAGFAAVEQDIFTRYSNPRGWEQIAVRLTLADLMKMVRGVKPGDGAGIDSVVAAIVAANLGPGDSETIRNLVVRGGLLRADPYRDALKAAKDALKAVARQAVGQLVLAQSESVVDLIGEITQYVIDPLYDKPTYRWMVNGIAVPFSSWREASSQNTFWIAVAEFANVRISRPLPPAVWEKVLDDRYPRRKVEKTLFDSTLRGQVTAHLSTFGTGRAKANLLEEILIGRPWTSEGRTYFLPSAFIEFLASHHCFPETGRLAMMMHDLGGEEHAATIKGKPTIFWSVAKREGQTEPFVVPRIEKEGPF